MRGFLAGIRADVDHVLHVANPLVLPMFSQPSAEPPYAIFAVNYIHNLASEMMHVRDFTRPRSLFLRAPSPRQREGRF
jgi:hypothetical protein